MQHYVFGVWNDGVTGEFIAVRGDLNLHLRLQTIARNDQFKVASGVSGAGKAIQIELRIRYRRAIVLSLLYAARDFACFLSYGQLNGVALKRVLLLRVNRFKLIGLEP